MRSEPAETVALKQQGAVYGLPSTHTCREGSASEGPAQAYSAGLLIQCSHDLRTIYELQILPSPTSTWWAFRNRLPHTTSTSNRWNPPKSAIKWATRNARPCYPTVAVLQTVIRVSGSSQKADL